MNSIISSFLIALTVLTFSCKKKVEDPLSSDGKTDSPSVGLSYGTGPFNEGDNFYMSIDVKTSKDLQKIEVTKKLGSNAAIAYQEVTTGFDGPKAHYFSMTSYTVENHSQITFSVTATDVEGDATTVDHVLSVNVTP